MILRGFNLTFPVCDLRPVIDPESRFRFISPNIVHRGKHYIKGFGKAEERKRLRIFWRSTETIYFDCSGAISLPDRLPDNEPVTFVNRRVYLDHLVLVRFELGIFTNPQHPYPESSVRRLYEYVNSFWNSEIRIKGQKDVKTFASALPMLMRRFVEMTSSSGHIQPEMFQELEPQLQVISEAPIGFDSEAVAVDNEGKILLSLRPVPIKNKAAPIDTALISYSPGYYFHPRGPQFDNFRNIRAHIAWLHADLEILMHISRLCADGQIDWDVVSGYLIDLADGFCTAQNPDYSYNEIIAVLMKYYRGRISRLIGALKESKLPGNVKAKLVKLIERPATRDEKKDKSTVTVIKLVEHNLRKAIGDQPKNEPQIQDALENLFLGADIEYSREPVAIEYSIKKYVPDFSIQKLDLSIEVKFCKTKARLKKIIAEINDDILAYQTKYKNLFFIVYDLGYIRDVDKFIGSFKAHKNVTVSVVKH